MSRTPRLFAVTAVRALSVLVVAVVFATLPVWNVSDSKAESPPISDSQAKAAFLVNIIKYVTWSQESKLSRNIDVGVLGRQASLDVWKGLNGKVVNGRKLNLLVSSDLDDLTGCQVIFIDASAIKQFTRTLSHLRGEPVLTVSDVEGVNPLNGAMVNLTIRRGRLSFTVNLKELRASGLQISSNVLKLATEVLK
ncbi:MAG: YfiR family protein [Desulfuromonadales bacterium]